MAFQLGTVSSSVRVIHVKKGKKESEEIVKKKLEGTS